MPVAAIGAVASLAGSAMAAGAAEDAADTQAASADRATASQEKMFNKQVELQKPWRDTGGLGLNRLAYELGLSRTPMYSASGPVETEQQIRQRLQSQYMRPGQGAPQQAPAAAVDPNVWSMERLLQEQGQAPRAGAATWMNGNDETGINGFGPQTPGGTGPTYDEAGLNAAVQAELQRQQAALAGQEQDYQGAEYGGLLRNFGAQDLYDDPSYQFRLDEGLKSRTRAYAGRGNFLSGAALKGIERYGQDYASTEYGKSFDRYNVNRDSKFNKLASVAGIGQVATNQTGAAAASFGSQMGNNIIGAGNAQAAGQVGAANAWNNGLGSAVGGFQHNELMRTLRQPVSYRYPVPTYEGAEY
jgi:hypothetical protein